MKFHKHFSWQLVPQWRECYCDYKLLKQELRKIKQQQRKDKRRTLLAWLDSRSKPEFVIAVNHHETGAFKCQLDPSATELEVRFFHQVDSQVSLVNEFYKTKELEFESLAFSLLLQMETAEKPGAAPETGGRREEKKLLFSALTDLHKQLSVLRDYSSLNRMAFWKILKKFDKVSGRHAAFAYMRAVEASYFMNSEKVTSVTEQVDRTIKAHFNEHHRIITSSASSISSFSFGLLTGCCLGLLIALLMLYLALPHKNSKANHLLSTVPGFSSLSLFVLHLCVYGCNVFFWQRSRINHSQTFGFQPGVDLKYHEVFFITLIFTTSLLFSIILTFSLESLRFGVDIMPMSIILFFLALLVLPYKGFYKSARYTLLCAKIRIVSSPLPKVSFADLFFADQLTSQASGLKGLGYSLCSYGSNYLGRRSSACESDGYQYTILLLPQWWRFLQLGNAGKYLCGMLAMMLKFTYARRKSTLWFALFVGTSIFATMYQFYWDIVIDWGLLQRDSCNPWLRDKLLVNSKAIYIISMVLNGLLRLSWLHSLLCLEAGADQMLLEFCFASLEVFRRGLWNFFRVENEYARSL